MTVIKLRIHEKVHKIGGRGGVDGLFMVKGNTVIVPYYLRHVEAPLLILTLLNHFNSKDQYRIQFNTTKYKLRLQFNILLL